MGFVVDLFVIVGTVLTALSFTVFGVPTVVIGVVLIVIGTFIGLILRIMSSIKTKKLSDLNENSVS